MNRRFKPAGTMEPNDKDRLVGWKAVAAAMGISESCAQRWARELGMPVYKIAQMVRASRAELAAWERKIKTKVRRTNDDVESPAT